MEITPKVILYQDAAVQITENQIIIRNYFSPIPIDKSFSFHQINDVFLLSKNANQNTLDSFNIFKPVSQSNNEHKISYIELWLKDSKSKPTFSPHDPQKVFKLIQTRLQHEQFKQNINLGMDNMKNSAKETYSGFLGKIGKIVQDTSHKIALQGQKWSSQLKGKSSTNKY